MAEFGLRRRQKAKQNQKDAKQAGKDEKARQDQLRRDEQQRAIFQTAEGQGIQEGANISLGFGEDEDDLFDFASGTGLVI